MGFARQVIIAGVYEHPTRWAPDKTQYQIHAERARGRWRMPNSGTVTSTRTSRRV